MPPLVSVIVPTYNHEKYIEQCIRSVMHQTFFDWELIVVDDGSTDGTGFKVLRLAREDQRLRIVNQCHRGIYGLNATYNTALKESQGTYIAILEGDDFWPDDKLAKQMAIHLANPDIILSYGATKIFSEGVFHSWHIKPSIVGDVTTYTFRREFLLNQAHIVPASAIIRRTALEEIGGFQSYPGFPATDLPTWLALSRLTGIVHVSADILGYWRRHDGQVTSQLSLKLADYGLKARMASWSQSGLNKREIYMANVPHVKAIYLDYLRNCIFRHDIMGAMHAAQRVFHLGKSKDKCLAIFGVLITALNLKIDLYSIVRRSYPQQ